MAPHRIQRKSHMSRPSVWAPKIVALIKGGNSSAAIAQIKVAPTVKDLQDLRKLLMASQSAQVASQCGCGDQRHDRRVVGAPAAPFALRFTAASPAPACRRAAPSAHPTAWRGCVGNRARRRSSLASSGCHWPLSLRFGQAVDQLIHSAALALRDWLHSSTMSQPALRPPPPPGCS